MKTPQLCHRGWREEIRSRRQELAQLDEHSPRFLEGNSDPASELLGATRRDLTPTQADQWGEAVTGDDAGHLPAATDDPGSTTQCLERMGHMQAARCPWPSEEKLEDDYRPHGADQGEGQGEGEDLPPSIS